MSNMVILKIKGSQTFLPIPLHEFNRYWVSDDLILEIDKIPDHAPDISVMCGLERGKGFKRVKQSYERKGKVTRETHQNL